LLETLGGVNKQTSVFPRSTEKLVQFDTIFTIPINRANSLSVRVETIVSLNTFQLPTSSFYQKQIFWKLSLEGFCAVPAQTVVDALQYFS